MKDQQVKYGRGAQTLRFVPIDRAGRPVRVTSATFVIVDVDESEDSTDREIASGSASLAAVNTTLAASGGAGEPDPRALVLTSGTGVTEGRQYLLSTAIGRSLVTVDAVSSASVQVKNTPSVAFPSGSAFQAIELEAEFPAGEANDSDAIEEGRRYQIVWTFTLQGEEWRTGQMIYLVRYSGEAWITEEDVIRAYPTLPDRIRGKCRISDAICVATEDLIAELESADQRAESYRTSTPGAVAIRNRAIEYCLRWCNTDPDTANADLYMARYERLVQNFITGTPGNAVKLDKATDQAVNARIDGIFNRG